MVAFVGVGCLYIGSRLLFSYVSSSPCFLDSNLLHGGKRREAGEESVGGWRISHSFSRFFFVFVFFVFLPVVMMGIFGSCWEGEKTSSQASSRSSKSGQIKIETVLLHDDASETKTKTKKMPIELNAP